MKFRSVYITARNLKQAEKIALHLLSMKLVACANIFPIESMHRWKNKIEKSKEVVMLCKTTQSNVKKVISEVKKLHDYEIPCILSFDIKEGSKDFLAWVVKETYNKRKKPYRKI